MATVECRVRVRYSEVGRQGFAHHASYFNWFDMALEELIKICGMSYEDIEDLGFNTAIARMMEFVNLTIKVDKVDREWMAQFVLVLAPFAPHMAEELWQRFDHTETLAYAPWPEYDEALLVEDTIKVPVQVNGKLRGRVSVSPDAEEEEIKQAALAQENVRRHLEGREIDKVVVVPGKLVNVVLN